LKKWNIPAKVLVNNLNGVENYNIKEINCIKPGAKNCENIKQLKDKGSNIKCNEGNLTKWNNFSKKTDNI